MSLLTGQSSLTDKSAALIYDQSERGSHENHVRKGTVNKAAVDTGYLSANGAYLLESQQNRMIAIMQKRPSILGVAAIQPMTSHQQRFDHGRFDSQVLHRANECENPSESQISRPDLGYAQLTAKTFKAVVPLSYDAIEDAIGRGDFVNTVLSQLTARAATDIEMLVIRGDVTSPSSFFSSWDGMLASAVSNIHLAAGAQFTSDVASDLIKTMPEEFRGDRQNSRFFLDYDSEQNARNSLASRATNLGDSSVVGNDAVEYFRIALLASDVWPNDLGVGNNETEVVYTSRENIGVGVWRDMRLEQDPDPTSQCINYVLTLRVAFSYMYEPAVAKAINVLAQ
jgi:hypothetical protein